MTPCVAFPSVAFALPLALYHSLISFLLSVPHIEPFITSDGNPASFTSSFLHGGRNCLKLFFL